jgi:hypothetical protein
MSAARDAPAGGGATWPTLATRAGTLRDEVRTVAAAHGRDDLVAILDGIPDMAADRPARVVVAGLLKRGKSTLVNTLVGRPLLSPVGNDIKTACWVEIGYGDEDLATVLLANAKDPGQPIRQAIRFTEIERYAALDEILAPALGVEVRVRSPLLENVLLVDTPGVGGLDAGHAQITLAALRQADAMLFVCDCSQPILAHEVDFLIEATRRVATVLIVISKSDIPGCEAIVSETRDRLARSQPLAGLPVFAVSPRLAVRAGEVGDATLAGRLTGLSGVEQLVSALRGPTATRRDALRIAKCAQVTASVAGLLADDLDEQAADPLGTRGRAKRLEEEEARLAAALADRTRLSLLIGGHLRRLRAEPRDMVAARTRELRGAYEQEAQRGPSAQLETLAARMTADLTAACTAAFDLARHRSEQLVRDLLDATGANAAVAEWLADQSYGMDLALTGPEAAAKTLSGGLNVAGDLFPTVLKLIAGSTVAVSVLTGPGVIAASLALVACAGWWATRGGAEQDRRATLRAWAGSAADQASASFSADLDRRVSAVERHLDTCVPALLDGMATELAATRRELTGLRQASAEALRSRQAGLIVARDLLRAHAAQAAEVVRAATTMRTGVER